MVCRIACFVLAACAVALPSPKTSFVREFGGSNADVPRAVARDRQGNIYVAGETESNDFPATVLQTKPGGASLYRIDAAGAVVDPIRIPGTVYFTAVAVDARNADTVFVGTNLGLRRSVDGGATWADASSGLPQHQITSLVVNLGGSGMALAAVPTDGIYKSADGGLSWSRSSTGLAPSREGNYPWWLTADPNHPETVFATSYSDALYRSDDGGATWQRQATFMRLLCFDPKRPGVVFGAVSGDVYKSADGGLTWTPLPAPNPEQNLYVNALAYSSDGRLYYGTTYVSSDDGQTWKSTNRYNYVTQVLADPRYPIIYGADGQQVLRTPDGFQTMNTVGPAAWGASLAAMGTNPRDPNGPARLFAATTYPTTDAFVAKLDPAGNLIWATYFGGAGAERVAGIAVDDQGNVFVAGQTSSSDFPVTPAAYQAAPPLAGSIPRAFVFKLTAGGSLVYSSLVLNFSYGPSTYGSSFTGVAVDSTGSAYLTGSTTGGLPPTAGLLQPDFRPAAESARTMSVEPRFPQPPPPIDAFALKLNPSGSELSYCVYLRGPVGGRDSGAAIAVDSAGNAWIGGNASLWKLSPSADQLLYYGELRGAQIAALTLDRDRNLLVTGRTSITDFYTTPGVFQPAMAAPVLAYPSSTATYTTDAFVAKFAPDGSKILYSTYLGGETDDSPTGIAADPQGYAYVTGTTSSRAFHTVDPTQGPFATVTSFLAKLTPDGSAARYSTYVGDNRTFLTVGVTANDEGDAVFTGYTQESDACCVPPIYKPGRFPNVFVTRLTEQTPKVSRIDAVIDSASAYETPISPAAAITVRGAGFAPAANLFLNGQPLEILSRSDGRITAVAPRDIDAQTVAEVRVEDSSPVLMPVAKTSPAIYSADGSGFGRALVFYEDGTLVSQDRPAKAGDILNVACNGIGRYTVQNGSAVPETPVSVYFSYAYAAGVDAQIRHIDGVPGEVFVIKVRMPELSFPASPSNLPPADAAVAIDVGGVRSSQLLSIAISPPQGN